MNFFSDLHIASEIHSDDLSIYATHLGLYHKLKFSIYGVQPIYPCFLTKLQFLIKEGLVVFSKVPMWVNI